MSDKLKIVFFGTPHFAVESLRAVIDSEHEVKAVVTAPDKPAGRGKKLRASAVKEFAEAHHIPVLQPPNLKDPDFQARLRAFGADMFVVAAFRMLPEAVWNMPPRGTVNVHASLLPQYRGAAPINHALMNGDTVTGVTTFKLTHAIDTGDILLRERVDIVPDDNAGTLHDKLMVAGARLLAVTLDREAAGTLHPRKQAELDPGEPLKPAPKLTRETREIDWRRSVEEIHNHIRGLSPYPAAMSTLVLRDGDKKGVKLFRSEPLTGTASDEPGTIFTEGKSLIANTGSGKLRILELQIEGKRKMDATAFLNGIDRDNLLCFKIKNGRNKKDLMSQMRITERKYLDGYKKLIGNGVPKLIEDFDFSENRGGFEYLTKSSAVYSSNIEGNSIDLNSYMNYEMNKDKFKAGKEIEEIEDLIEAYEFAQGNNLNEKNLLNCHKIFSNTLLIKSKRGTYRVEKIGVFGKSGLAYMAVEPELVEKEMNVFFQDLSELISSDLNEIEVFYFASLIHLRFAHIHPFRDGNGRAARLMEKWFVTEKLGRDFWKMPSEEYYKKNQARYYETINLGVNFYELNYDKCIGFLEMLPNCMK